VRLKHLKANLILAAIILVALGVNWAWWMDGAISPPVKIYHDMTYTSDVKGHRKDTFKPGETVVINLFGSLVRDCERKYLRTLRFPNGGRVDLAPSRGSTTRRGQSVNNINHTMIWVNTFPDWPGGKYRFT
jgi:hypothetical protein